MIMSQTVTQHRKQDLGTSFKGVRSCCNNYCNFTRSYSKWRSRTNNTVRDHIKYSFNAMYLNWRKTTVFAICAVIWLIISLVQQFYVKSASCPEGEQTVSVVEPDPASLHLGKASQLFVSCLQLVTSKLSHLLWYSKALQENQHIYLMLTGCHLVKALKAEAKKSEFRKLWNAFYNSYK